MKKILLSIIFVSLFGSAVYSQDVRFQPDDKIIFDRYVAYIADKTNLTTDKTALTTDQIIIETAKFFLGTPYVASTLEFEPEGLVINLRQLDCTTFVESVYALSMMVKSGNLNFENFCNKLRWLRYREGVINDYTDRLHYTSDWIYTNQHKGIVKNVTKSAGGQKLSLNLSIMSSNTDKFKQLKGKQELIDKIIAKEAEINSREHYFLPTEDIDKNAAKIKSGDIVGFVTTIKGLDISHVGIIYKDGNNLTFIHASSSARKVIINKEPLSEFVKGTNGRNTGIVVVRANF
jgi:cell wall-associated NlpC family hydrolase